MNPRTAPVRVAALAYASGLFALLCSAGSYAAYVDLTGWTSHTYSFGGSAATNWLVDPLGVADNTLVRQTENGRATTFLSDYSLDHSVDPGFSGLILPLGNDDDQIGFVFGVQSTEQLYLFQWKQCGFGPSGDCQNSGAEQGAHLRRVDTLLGDGAGSLTNADFEGSGDTNNSTVLARDVTQTPWVNGAEYRFGVVFNPGGFTLTILENGAELFNWSIADTTFTDGQVGFFNASQADTDYRMSTEVIPLPAAAILFSSALAVLGWKRRRYI